MACHSFYISYIRRVHSDEIIVFVIILPCKLYRPFPLAGNAVLAKLRSCAVVNGISYLLSACCRRSYHKLVFKTFLFDHVLENKLRHRTPADIAVADE